MTLADITLIVILLDKQNKFLKIISFLTIHRRSALKYYRPNQYFFIKFMVIKFIVNYT